MFLGPTKILGFGSLLSEQSARTTFPDLGGFRLVRVHGYRRVFAHAAAVFFERGIANAETLEFASLSAEPRDGASFVAACFEVDMDAASWARFDGDAPPALPRRPLLGVRVVGPVVPLPLGKVFETVPEVSEETPEVPGLLSRPAASRRH